VTEIEHWIESGAPADVLELLGAGRSEAPAPELVERCATLAAAGIGLAATVADGAALEAGRSLLGQAVLGQAGVKAASGTLSVVKWGLLGLAAGTTFAGGAELVRRAAVSTAQTPPIARTAAPAPARATIPTALPLPSAPGAAPDSPLEVPAVAQPRLAAPTPSSPLTGTDERLRAELELLHRIRVKLDAQELGSTSQLFREHERRFGSSSALSPEARYLRLEVLVGSGELEAAKRLASEIIQRDDKGPHVARAKEILQKK
jgi:hypothetical protein